MNGVYIGEEDGHLLFVSTDGRRMHLYRDRTDYVRTALEGNGVDTKAITGHNFGVKNTADMLVIGEENAGQFPNWRKEGKEGRDQRERGEFHLLEAGKRFYSRPSDDYSVIPCAK
jgi:hypothetical protein